MQCRDITDRQFGVTPARQAGWATTRLPSQLVFEAHSSRGASKTRVMTISRSDGKLTARPPLRLTAAGDQPGSVSATVAPRRRPAERRCSLRPVRLSAHGR